MLGVWPVLDFIGIILVNIYQRHFTHQKTFLVLRVHDETQKSWSWWNLLAKRRDNMEMVTNVTDQNKGRCWPEFCWGNRGTFSLGIDPHSIPQDSLPGVVSG